MNESFSSKQQTEIEVVLRKKGWFVLRLPDPGPVYAAREALTARLRSLTGTRSATLENYHRIPLSDKQHTRLQLLITKFFRSRRFGRKIIQAQLGFFQRLIGRDIDIQTNPYLRIVRPGKVADNIGYHRDTFYGATPFELSISVPFVDIEKKAALSVITGSHVRPESDFPTRSFTNLHVTKGSAVHRLGFLYKPKEIYPSHLKALKPVPALVGQALIFNLSLVHGCVENRSHQTRWSTDIRMVNATAPIDLSSRPKYYEPLCRSPLTEQAQAYYKANRKTLVLHKLR